MAGLDDLGAAFTGQSTTDPATANAAWGDWMERPGNRQALLQMGLQLMQPVGIGQTPFGHIGQAIGAGGEAASRVDDADLKTRVADAKIANADEKLRILQQNADSGAVRASAAASRAASRGVGGLTEAFKERARRQDEAAYEKRLDKDATTLFKQANDLLASKDDPTVMRYKGKSQIEIRDMLRSERPKPKSGILPAASEDDSEDTTTSPDPVVEQAPYPGAKKAPDGNWYVADPKNPGKYLKVNTK